MTKISRTSAFKRAALGSTAIAVGLLHANIALAFGEAPMLAEKVAAGELPPVEERLPSEPYVEEVFDSIGTYGGTWRSAILGGGDNYNILRSIGNEHLVRWNPEWTRVVPNIAKDVQVNDAGNEFTFSLRDGMRWSDGDPFDADDIMFWYEDVLMNSDLTSSPNNSFVVNGKPVVVEKIDQHTVVFKFDAPYGLFLQELAYGAGMYPTMYPRHYLEQFHAKYNPDGIQALIDAEPAAEDWVSLFNSKIGPMFTGTYWQNPDLPVLHGWKLTNIYGKADTLIAERNPYYWKVDNEGNQLPYLDNVTWAQVEDVELMLLKATGGEIDYAFRHIVGAPQRAVLHENQERGNYRFFDQNQLNANDVVLFLNLNHKDDAKAKILSNTDVRKALSLAINRQEIIDTIYLGLGEPGQVAPQPYIDIWDEEVAGAYTEFDPAKANEMLDAAGLTEKDSEGFRLDSNGDRISIIFLVADLYGWNYPDVIEMVRRYWADVGVDVQIRATDRARLFDTVNANDWDAYVFPCTGGMLDIYSAPQCYFPYQPEEVTFAQDWASYYQSGGEGEAPPEYVLRQFELYDSILVETDADKRNEMMSEIVKISSDNLYTIGLVRPVPIKGIAKNNLRNVLEPLPIGGVWHPAPNTVQLYLEGGVNE